MGILLALVVIYFACIIIARASDGFEAAADYLGRNLTDGVKGATINAIGSSLPELMTTFFFLVLLKDAEGFASGLGTTAGSAIFNGVIIPATVIFVVVLGGLAKGIELSRKVIIRDGITLIVCELILIFFISGNELRAIHGLLLMFLYAGYVAIMLLGMTKNEFKVSPADFSPERDPLLNKNQNPLLTALFFSWLDLPRWLFSRPNRNKAIGLLAFSAIIMGFACHLLVEACIWLGSDEFTLFGSTFAGVGIPVYFLSVIVASAATSLPDTILSMKDARKGNYDDAVSNALGSNIFDICFALGFPLFLYTLIYGPIDMTTSSTSDVGELRILLLAVTGLAFLIFFKSRSMKLKQAWMLVALYGLFSVYIIGRALGWTALEPLAETLNNISNYLGGLF
ncbi:sodium:calcium antiporter [Luteibaculum oceani]|uniref:Sodium:calcium antiporter n=1 Tax=Luteibaculum oceani TaxID=1294296 RepID=A0A5C6VPY6_9FLAO|nr:sodium:calcium antiporter [Luteibaculum oceani]TXC85468.1 sodium:calcium antiporter [Luteibaculum oceani]